MRNERLISLVHIGTFVLVVIISLLAKTPSALPASVSSAMGIVLFAAGFAIFGWALAYLRLEALGMIEPRSPRLLEVGPYRYVRHPLYLGVIIGLIGLALALHSLWGAAAALALFVPMSIYRARLEEEAIARRFPEQWQAYVRDTYFLIPFVY
ncbi:MAG: methyltransferase family protein [Anaerolineae bacterium]